MIDHSATVTRLSNAIATITRPGDAAYSSVGVASRATSTTLGTSVPVVSFDVIDNRYGEKHESLGDVSLNCRRITTLVTVQLRDVFTFSDGTSYEVIWLAANTAHGIFTVTAKKIVPQ